MPTGGQAIAVQWLAVRAPSPQAQPPGCRATLQSQVRYKANVCQCYDLPAQCLCKIHKAQSIMTSTTLLWHLYVLKTKSSKYLSIYLSEILFPVALQSWSNTNEKSHKISKSSILIKLNPFSLGSVAYIANHTPHRHICQRLSLIAVVSSIRHIYLQEVSQSFLAPIACHYLIV